MLKMGVKTVDKTYALKASEVERNWVVIDAEGQILGRVATKVAAIIRGKDKPTFTPSMDTGDFVIVVNVDKLKVTGNRMDDKLYYRYSGYPGGLKSRTLRQVMDTNPERALRQAVWGMLPKNRLGRKLIKKLKMYRGSEHPHAAQQPRVVTP